MASNWRYRIMMVLLILPLIPAVLVSLALMGHLGTPPCLSPACPEA